MEKKILIVLFIIFSVEMSSIISGVDCRALRKEQTNGCNRLAAVDGGAFNLISPTVAANSSRIRLMRSLTFRLASGPSKRGPGH
ncbi:hypothetical protein Bca4012_072723 [Brassica carinata]|uniref:Uncharacterized protein n=2 Tax=Brassica TaxID=3705 RepID=A0A8X7U983_BRACI|nr:hypothetical protein Bca52824_065082 [Brassica carinata]CAF1929950.1 unnamed protein product [Brassica napus]CDY25674.1 BnaC05g25530D [Brassica napus]